MRRLLVPAILAIVSATGAVIAVAAAPDPVIGTWQLNVSKSTFKGGPALKSQVRMYSQSGQSITKSDVPLQPVNSKIHAA